MHIRLINLIALSLLIQLITGCGSNNVNEPTELEDLKSKIKVIRLWKKDVGVGSDDNSLSLQLTAFDDQIYTIDADGEIFSIDQVTGKKSWNLETEERVTSGIFVDQSKLYYTTMQGELVSLSSEDGSEVWRQRLTSESVAPPSSNGSIVVVQTIDGKVTAFDAQTGNQRWRFDSVAPKLSLRGTSTPVVLDEITIAGFATGELVAFDNGSGNQLWASSVGTPQGRTELERLVDVDSQPILTEDLVYSVSFQGNLSAINLENGRELWSKRESSYAGIARGFSHLYVSNSDGIVSAYKEKNAQPAWKTEKLKYRRLSSPVVFKNTVVVADLEGYVHFISQIDGDLLARVRPDSDGVMGNMKVANDKLFIYTNSGELFAYAISE